MFLDVTHYPAQDLQDLYSENLLYFTRRERSTPVHFVYPNVSTSMPFFDIRSSQLGQRFYLNIEE